MKKQIEIIATDGTNEYQIYFPSVREVEENYYSRETNSACFSVEFITETDYEIVYQIYIYWQSGRRFYQKIDRRKKYREILRLFGVDINE